MLPVRLFLFCVFAYRTHHWQHMARVQTNHRRRPTVTLAMPCIERTSFLYWGGDPTRHQQFLNPSKAFARAQRSILHKYVSAHNLFSTRECKAGLGNLRSICCCPVTRFFFLRDVQWPDSLQEVLHPLLGGTFLELSLKVKLSIPTTHWFRSFRVAQRYMLSLVARWLLGTLTGP